MEVKTCFTKKLHSLVVSQLTKFLLSQTMYKKIFNLMVLMTSVLIIQLLTGYITNYIIHLNTGLSPFKITALAMVALVFVLVPSYRYMSSKVEVMIARLLLSGSNSLGKTMGLLLSFVLIFGILFLIYLYHWFNINIFDYVSNGDFK